MWYKVISFADIVDVTLASALGVEMCCVYSHRLIQLSTIIRQYMWRADVQVVDTDNRSDRQLTRSIEN